jgi:predicted flap endonuclease-1-like 5' DNA nuclease
MKILCEDGLVLDCTDFKAIDTGVIVIGGEEDQGAVGYVPNERVEYVLPDEVVEVEHERLGVPAPELRSAEELEARLDAFVDELEALRENLDRQVEDLIDEGAPLDEGDVEGRDRLYERRREIDRALEQVRTRAKQFEQLSLTEVETGSAEPAEGMDSESGASTEAATTDVDALRSEMDERLSAIERQLEALTGSTDATGADAGGGATDPATDEIAGISGLGTTYRQRLEDAGIRTLGDLAESDPSTVAGATNVSENKAQGWIDAASDRIGETRTPT